jgi:oligopeptide transport system substrate-binding protein
LNYAVDREALVRYVIHGQAVAARGVLPPGIPGADTSLGYRFDPDKAKALLTEAGYPGGKGLPTLTLQLGPNEQTATVAEVVQQQWARVGVHVELRQVDFPQHLDMVRSGKLALWRTQWVADYCDPENFLALFASANKAPGGPNTTRYANGLYDAMYERLLAPSLDNAERRRLSTTMDSLIVADAPWVFLYYPRTVRLLQPAIRNFSCDPLGRFSIADVEK